MFYVNQKMLEKRKYIKSKLDEIDAEIYDTFNQEIKKLSETGNDAGIVEIIGQLPLDFRNIATLYQAALDIQNARKKPVDNG
jgi:hypothetical protein